jgi:hypothetical protein
MAYRSLANDEAAKAHAVTIADGCGYVLIWQGLRRMGLVASLSRAIEFFPAA